MTEPVTLRLIGDNGQLVGVLRQTTQEQEKYRKSTEETSKSLKKVSADSNVLAGSMDKVKGSALDLARTMAAGLGFAGVAASITLAIKNAADFNQEIAKVSTALSDTSQLQNYAKQTRQFALDYGIAAKRQAAALYEIISAGQDAATAMDTLNAANRLGVGGLTTVETAADGLTSIMNAYAGKIQDAAQVSDILFAGAAAGKTNIEQLSSTLGLVSNTASVVGVSLEELVASISTITLSGVQTSVAVTQMRAALNGVIKPSAQAAELAEQLGLQFDVAAVKTKGWAGFLADVQEKTGGNVTQLTTLFGSVEAVGGVLSLTGEKADKFAGVLDQVQNSAGATDVAFNKMAETAQQSFNRASEAATELSIRMGDKLLVALAPLAEAFADNIDAIAAAMELALKVGTAYVAIFVVLPAIYNAATAAITRYTAAVISNALAQEMGMKSTITAMGAVKTAGGVLFAAFAGWQFGTYLRDQFVEVRIAAIYFVESTLKAWNYLKAGVLGIWEAIKFGFFFMADAVQESFAAMLRKFASAADVQIMGKSLFGETSEELNLLADSMSSALDPTNDLLTALGTIDNELKAANKEVESITGEMVDFEYATASVAKAEKKAGDAAKVVVPVIANLGNEIGNTAEEIERFRKEAEAAEQALSQQLDIYYGLQESQQMLADGYANEIAMLSMTNEERRVANEMMRFMQQNYEALTAMSEEAAKAELERAEASIRAGEAGIAAGEELNHLIDQFGDLNNTKLGGLLTSLGKVKKALEVGKDAMGNAFSKEKIQELEATVQGLNNEIAQETVSNLRTAADAMAGLFEEGSKGQKRMQQASAALMIVQGALAAIEGVRAVLNQSKGDPYSAFGRMAAMAAAVAPLLTAIGAAIPAFGGGGGGGSNGAAARQERQGTGTVLGDAEAKSESIANATEITAEATKELVGINRGMLTALQAMQKGISGAAAGVSRIDFEELSLAGGFGSSIPLIGGLLSSIFGGGQELIDQGIRIRGGAFGSVSNAPRATSYQTVETDGGWFGRDRTRESTQALGADAVNQISLVLTSIGDAVREGALALGLSADEVDAAIESFRLAEIRISTMDLSGEEAQAELEAVFSSIFDDLAGAVVPFVAQFQQVGEGLGETLVRVATSVQVTQEAIRQLGLTLSNELGPEAMAQVSVALVEAAGGIEAFISGMQSFVANFAPEAHKFTVAQDALTSAFAQVGLELPTTRDGMWELMQSLDATTESGQAQIATLLRLAGVADAYYDMLEDRAENALEAVSARTPEQRQEALGIIGGVVNSRTYANMTTAQRAIADVNARFSDLRIALNETNPTLEEAGLLQQQYTLALEDANAALQAQGDALVGNLLFEESLVGMTALQQAQARINREFDGYVDQLVDLGFELDSVEVSTVNNIRAARLLREENDALAESAEQAASAVATISLGEIDQMIEEWFQGLVEMARRFFGDGAKEWISELTGVELRDAPSPLATRAGTLNRFMEERAAFVQDMNAQLVNLQQQLEETPWQATGTIAMLQGRIENINRVLQLIGDGVGEAVDYINAVFDQQIGDLLDSLSDEFGTNNPIEDINKRFDEMIVQATAWGATVEQLAQIEQYRLIALAQAEEENFNQTMDYYEQLRAFRDSLLLDEQLTTLTPAERMAEALAQYETTRAAAMAGDATALSNFEGVGRSYLEELRSFFGSSEGYTQGFNRVLADINTLLGNSPAGVVSTLIPNTDGAAAGTGQPATVQVDPVASEVIALRETTAEGFTLMVESMQAVAERLDLLVGGQAVTNTELRGIREGAIVRTN